jgi:hypothetical protein
VSRLTPTLSSARIVWVGRPPPTDSAHPVVAAAELEQAVTTDPMAQVLVYDVGDGVCLEDQLGVVRIAALRPFTVVLVVDEPKADLLGMAANAGVFTCLPRSAPPSARDKLLESALDHLHAFRRSASTDVILQRAAALTSHAHFELRTLDEAEALASLLAACASNPERRIGGFLELLVNSIEHGNLEITGEDKRALLREGRWHREVEARLADPKWASRKVRVSVERHLSGAVEFAIEDDGAGFDFARVVSGGLTENLHRHGRGIALARLMSFDELFFEGRGNRVIGRILP